MPTTTKGGRAPLLMSWAHVSATRHEAPAGQQWGVARLGGEACNIQSQRQHRHIQQPGSRRGLGSGFMHASMVKVIKACFDPGHGLSCPSIPQTPSTPYYISMLKVIKTCFGPPDPFHPPLNQHAHQRS